VIHPIGYFKIWRDLFTKPIWLNSTSEQKVILITLIAMANFRENQWEWQGKKFQLKPGQFITSLNSIARECGGGVTMQNVRTALVRFENLEFLTNESTKTGRLISIANWQVYQSEKEITNKETNKDLTKSQQRANKDLTTKEEGKEGKEGKEGNKVRKNIYGEYHHIKLTQKEYDKLQEDFGNAEELIKHLDEYIEMRGTKYKNHNLAIRKWVVNAVREKMQKKNTNSSNIFDEIGKEEGYW
jgi:hypothetical protein